MAQGVRFELAPRRAFVGPHAVSPGTGPAREPDAHDAQAPYSYYDAAKPPPDAQLMQSPPPPVSAANPPEPDPAPVQITRRHPINPETMAMNRAYWALPEIRGTVWANYMLVASQWPTAPLPNGPNNDGRYFPGMSADPNSPMENYQQAAGPVEANQNVANTTMETYAQDAPASCMSCHHVVSNALGRDFVGITELNHE